MPSAAHVRSAAATAHSAAAKPAAPHVKPECDVAASVVLSWASSSACPRYSKPASRSDWPHVPALQSCPQPIMSTANACSTSARRTRSWPHVPALQSCPQRIMSTANACSNSARRITRSCLLSSARKRVVHAKLHAPAIPWPAASDLPAKWVMAWAK